MLRPLIASWRRLAFLSLLIICPTLALRAQEPELELRRVLQESDPVRMQQEIDSLIDRYRGTSFELYAGAMLEGDALRAADKYRNLIERYPESKYAGEAMIRLGEFYFSRGLYVSARKHFLDFVKKFPTSASIHKARYLALASLCAISRNEACYNEMKTFLVDHSRSPYVELVKEDIGSMRQFARGPESVPASVTKPVAAGQKYTLQVGAFSNVNNALNLKTFCDRNSVPVEIRETSVESKTVYLVWVGTFESWEEAEDFGQQFELDHGKPYRVIARF